MKRDELKMDYYNNQILISRDLKKISLDYLPCYQGDKGSDGAILSSCNGLLLCYNRCQGDRVVFYVCNPVTKQWTSIPPAPVSCKFLRSFAPVGFTCDPNNDTLNLNLNPNPSSCRFRFRILRAFGSSSSFSDSTFDVDIFSSETGQWTTKTVTRLGGFWNRVNYSPTRVITYKGKLHVQVGQSILVYDPYACKLEADIDPPKENLFSGSVGPLMTYVRQADGSCKMHVEMNPPAEPNQVVGPMEGFSCCCGSLWTCQLRNKASTLYIWRLKEDKDSDSDSNSNSNSSPHHYWSLEKKVSVDPLKCTDNGLANECMASGRVLILHPDDPNMVYLSLSDQGLIVLWNLESGTMEVVHQSANTDLYSWAKAFLIEAPTIPYSIPEFPSVLSCPIHE